MQLLTAVENKLKRAGCRNGASRSGMDVVAYVMKRDGSSRDEAIALVRTQRSDLRPNPAFMQLLADWGRSLKLLF
jgi:protein-tyrosine phosphatase